MDCLFTSCATDCPDDLLLPLASLSCTTDFSWSFIRKKKCSKYVCEITKRVSPLVESCMSIACDIYSERLIENISCKLWPLKWPDSPSWLLHIYLWKLWPDGLADDSTDPLLDPSLACNLHSCHRAVPQVSQTAGGFAWMLQTRKVLSCVTIQINTMSG